VEKNNWGVYLYVPQWETEAKQGGCPISKRNDFHEKGERDKGEGQKWYFVTNVSARRAQAKDWNNNNRIRRNSHRTSRLPGYLWSRKLLEENGEKGRPLNFNHSAWAKEMGNHRNWFFFFFFVCVHPTFQNCSRLLPFGIVCEGMVGYGFVKARDKYQFTKRDCSC